MKNTKRNSIAAAFLLSACFVGYASGTMLRINKENTPVSIKKPSHCEGICAVSMRKELSSLGLMKRSSNSSKIFIVDYSGDFNVKNTELFSDKIVKVMSLALPTDLVMIKIESGGGDVIACTQAYDQVERLSSYQIKTAAITDYSAQSCGYMLASAADTIYAASGARVGNIGVVTSTSEVTNIIGTTREKEISAGAKIITESDRKIMVSMITRTYDDFVARVNKKRANIINTKEAFNGLGYSGLEAKEIGLIDEVITYRGWIAKKYTQGYSIYRLRNIK